MAALTDPDAFWGDVYGWLTNQCSHILLGMFLTFAVCLIYYVTFGEMPGKGYAYMGIAVWYIGFVEIYKQGWRGIDTIEDSVFVVGYGASSLFASFTEIEAGSPVVAVDIIKMIPFVCVAACHLVAGSVFRAG